MTANAILDLYLNSVPITWDYYVIGWIKIVDLEMINIPDTRIRDATLD